MGTVHCPEHPVLYGSWMGKTRAPAVFLEARSKEVADWIRSDPEGPFVDMEAEGHWNSWGFVEDETMLKADWHAVQHLCHESDFFVPRLTRQGMLQQAPLRML